jgi:hypothetical protein
MRSINQPKKFVYNLGETNDKTDLGSMNEYKIIPQTKRMIRNTRHERRDMGIRRVVNPGSKKFQ